MIEKLIEVLSQVAGIGVFAFAIADRVAGFIKRRQKAQREARKRPQSPENK